MKGVKIKYIPEGEEPRISWKLASGEIEVQCPYDMPIGRVEAAVDTLQGAMEQYLGHMKRSIASDMMQGPRTKEQFMIGQHLPPSGETMRELGRIVRKYADSPEWAAQAAYTLGLIHGKKAERARKHRPQNNGHRRSHSRVELEPGDFPYLKGVIDFDRGYGVLFAPSSTLISRAREALQNIRNTLDEWLETHDKKAHDAGHGKHGPKSKLQED